MEEEGEDEEEEGRTLPLKCAVRTTRRKDAATRGVMVLRYRLCEVVIWWGGSETK